MITVPLGAQATLPDIAAIQQAIAAAFAADEPEITVDAGEVADADFSLIQLIEAARTHAQHTGRTLRLAAPANAVLAEVLARAGLAPATPGDVAFWLHGGCTA